MPSGSHLGPRPQPRHTARTPLYCQYAVEADVAAPTSGCRASTVESYDQTLGVPQLTRFIGQVWGAIWSAAYGRWLTLGEPLIFAAGSLSTHLKPSPVTTLHVIPRFMFVPPRDFCSIGLIGCGFALQALAGGPHTPVVLAHGFGSGLGLWGPSIDTIVQQQPKRRVVAFDWLGMGGSSRPPFTKRTGCSANEVVDESEDFFWLVVWHTLIMLG